MAAPRKVGKEKWSAKNDTWTDRNGNTVSGMREKGFTRGSAKGLLASDISGLVEVRADNREAIANAIDLALVAALEEVGLVAEGYAKRACPVDTGRLRNSITHIVDEGTRHVVIGTNVEYAPYVELGTRHQKPQPYLKPAAKDHYSTYKGIFLKHLRG
ncbi:HK97-gp10 family putative phage morphogenesis protein [Collinsella sp. CLA-JM-H32B]|uniref:HK97-gp10 family putative phage morphogenesis protein n=1 Tax=Collinsella sp. CLA-JM-H32B TaxID=3136221 RepID=UPI0032C09D66